MPNGRDVVAEYLNKHNEQLMNGHSAKVSDLNLIKKNTKKIINIIF